MTFDLRNSNYIIENKNLSGKKQKSGKMSGNLEIQKSPNYNNVIEKQNYFMVNDYYCYFFLYKKEKNLILNYL